jgi:hypothetical protein
MQEANKNNPGNLGNKSVWTSYILAHSVGPVGGL